MSEHLNIIEEIKLAFQSALIGEIYPEIRAIAFDFTEGILSTKLYLDRNPTETDYENISCVVTEVISNFSFKIFQNVSEECIFSNEPLRVLSEISHSLVYARKE